MAINKVVYDGATLIDLTDNTVTADKLMAGETATDRSGESITGTYVDEDTTYTLTKSGNTITLTGSDGSTTSVTDSNTTYTVMTQTQATAGTSTTGYRISPKVLHDTIQDALPTVPTITDIYSGTSSNGMSGKAVKSAIDAIHGSVSGSAGSGKTLTAFSQANGVVNATFGSISITKSQVSDFPTIPSKTSDLQNDSGFITGYTETDPVFTASDAYGISSADITNWDNAYDGNISFDTTAVSGDDYNLTQALTTLGWLSEVIV